MATEINHIRCADQTKKHQHHNREQGSANGQLNAQGTTPTRSEDATKDLPSMCLLTPFLSASLFHVLLLLFPSLHIPHLLSQRPPISSLTSISSQPQLTNLLPVSRPRLRRASPPLHRQRGPKSHRRPIRRCRTNHPARSRLRPYTHRPPQTRLRI